jgi:hypothetical protein
MYRYILRESCSQFDSLPLTSLTMRDPAMPNFDLRFLWDLSLLFVFSFGGAMLFQQMGAPHMAGYMLGGMLIGPSALDLVESVEQVFTMAQVCGRSCARSRCSRNSPGRRGCWSTHTQSPLCSPTLTLPPSVWNAGMPCRPPSYAIAYRVRASRRCVVLSPSIAVLYCIVSIVLFQLYCFNCIVSIVLFVLPRRCVVLYRPTPAFS